MRSVSSSDLDLMRAIEAGQVRRDDLDGTRRGMWALYMRGDVEVGLGVRRLRRLALADVPLVGPPTLTADGQKFLRDSIV